MKPERERDGERENVILCKEIKNNGRKKKENFKAKMQYNNFILGIFLHFLLHSYLFFRFFSFFFVIN